MFEDNYSGTLLCGHQRAVNIFVLLTGRFLTTGLHEVMSHSYTALLFFSNACAAIIPSMRKYFLIRYHSCNFHYYCPHLLSTSTTQEKYPPRKSPPARKPDI